VRLNVPIVNSSIFFQPLLSSFLLISIYYANFISFRQLDMKRVIAYSSIAHMNCAVMGLLSMTEVGYIGGFLMIFSHAFISAALFFLIGVLYDRVKTKVFYYFSGLVLFLPLISTLLFLSSLANIGFPLTFNFVSEMFVMTGVFQESSLVGMFLILSTIFSSVVSI